MFRINISSNLHNYIISNLGAISTHPANTKPLYNITLDERRRRWADVVLLLYKYFVFSEQLPDTSLKLLEDDDYSQKNTIRYPRASSG